MQRISLHTHHGWFIINEVEKKVNVEQGWILKEVMVACSKKLSRQSAVETEGIYENSQDTR
jgi:hypothetical protein